MRVVPLGMKNHAKPSQLHAGELPQNGFVAKQALGIIRQCRNVKRRGRLATKRLRENVDPSPLPLTACVAICGNHSRSLVIVLFFTGDVA
jgi:hypothetical protein